QLAEFADSGGAITTAAAATTGTSGEAPLDEVGNPLQPTHLRCRATMRRRLYERRWTEEDDDNDNNDHQKSEMLYHGRDSMAHAPSQSRNVSEIARAICRQPFW